MKKNIVRPVGLKGKEKTSRMIELMGENVERNTKNYVIELTKKGPDGKVYAIVRENHQYFIKVTDKIKDVIAEDFKYMGGLQNKTEMAYPSYAKAIKQLNLKFINLSEAHNKDGVINVFENDELISEENAIGAGSMGFATETVFEDEESMKEDVDEMNEGDDFEAAEDAAVKDDKDDEDEDKIGDDAYDPKGQVTGPFGSDIRSENFRMKISTAISEDVKKKV